MLNIVDTYRTFTSSINRAVEGNSTKEKCVSGPYHIVYLAAYQITESSNIQVLLTGVTGSLGAHLLNEFLTDSQVAIIYCLVRATSQQKAEERVAYSMAARGVAESFQLRRHKVLCLAADFANNNLGLSEEDYSKLRRNLTLIIHCAWPVNCE